jgi:acetyl esterase
MTRDDIYACFDPVIRDLSRRAESLYPQPPHFMNPAQVKAIFEANRAPRPSRDARLHVSDLPVPGPSHLMSRLYTLDPGARPGGFVYFHGGSFTTGDLDSADPLCCAIALHTCLDVLSIDYRLLPDHPFPAAFDDAVRAIEWVLEGGTKLDAARVCVAGDSSGANLAVAGALALRGRLAPRALWLAYPILGTDFGTRSYRENGDAPLLTRARCQRIFEDYLQAPLSNADWRAAPLLAADFSGLPPAVVMPAQYDPLSSDGEILVERLLACGVDARLIPADGMPHGFLKWIERSAAARRVFEQSLTAASEMLGQEVATAAAK